MKCLKISIVKKLLKTYPVKNKITKFTRKIITLQILINCVTNTLDII